MAACATPSAPPPAVKQPAPQACDPRMTVASKAVPPLPAGASVVQSVTPAEQAASAAFFQWVASLIDVAKVNGAQADVGRTWCAAQALGASLNAKP